METDALEPIFLGNLVLKNCILLVVDTRFVLTLFSV